MKLLACPMRHALINKNTFEAKESTYLYTGFEFALLHVLCARAECIHEVPSQPTQSEQKRVRGQNVADGLNGGLDECEVSDGLLELEGEDFSRPIAMECIPSPNPSPSVPFRSGYFPLPYTL